MVKNKMQNILLLLLLMVVFSCAPTLKVREVSKMVPEQYQGQPSDTLNSVLVNWNCLLYTSDAADD